MANETVELDERARVEELLDPLVGKQLPGVVLPLDRRFAARVGGFLAQLREPIELPLGRFVGRGHGVAD